MYGVNWEKYEQREEDLKEAIWEAMMEIEEVANRIDLDEGVGLRRAYEQLSEAYNS